MDKNQAIVDYLISCPAIKNNPLFFNFADIKDNNKQLVTVANEKALDKPYIDGSVLKQYTFTIMDYKSVAYNAIVKLQGYTDENISDMMDVQSIIDWIAEQNNAYSFPDFGDECTVESIEALTDNPSLNGVDTSAQPALAKYSITIRVQYLDNSKVLWR